MRSRLLVIYAWFPFVLVGAGFVALPIAVASAGDDERYVAVALALFLLAPLVHDFPRARRRERLPAVWAPGLEWAPRVLVDLGDGAEAHPGGELRVGLATLVSADREAAVAAALADPVTPAYERAQARLDDAERSRSPLWRAFARRGRRIQPARLRPPGAFAAYWVEEVAPCVQDGYRPPIVEGWLRRRDPRGQLPMPLADPDRVERELLEALRDRDDAPLVPIGWDRVAMAVWRPRISEFAAEYAASLAAFTVGDLIDAVGINDTPQWADAVAAALVATLTETGWTLTGRPGTFRLESDSASIDPFGLVTTAGAGTESPDEWRAFAAEHGIAGRPLALGSLAAAAQPQVADLPTAITGPARVFELPRSTTYRRDARIWTGVWILAWALAAGTLAFAAVTSSPWWIAPDAVLTIGVFTYIALRLRTARSGARLIVDHEGLRIEDPVLLDGPLVIRREALTSATFDTDGHDRRFALNDLLQRPVWLWERGEPTLLPLYGPGHETPNLALTFGEGIVMPPVRRSAAGGLYSGEALAGLLLEVPDADGLRTALRDWRVLRTLGEDDWRRVSRVYLGHANAGPGSPRVDLARERAVRNAWLLVAAGAIVPFAALIGVRIGWRLRAQGVAGQVPLMAVGAGVFIARATLYLL